MEAELFQVLPQLKVLICRHCGYGVRLPEAENHLKNQHALPHADVASIIQAIRQWPQIEQENTNIQIPTVLDIPLPILPCHRRGLLCQRGSDPCRFIASTMESLRKHWRQVHHWSQQTRRGRLPPSERARSEAELQRSFRTVSWQQVFPSGRGSHYIHIRFPDGRQSPQPAPDQAQHAVDAVIRAWEAAERAQAGEPIQPDSITDANPWLRFTQWAVFLRDIPPEDLLRSVAAPDPEDLAQGRDSARGRHPAAHRDRDDAVETAIQALWGTVDQLARKSQRTVQHCGSAIRMEAVRTQQKELPYRPLLAYMDEESIQRHVYPWQQLLTFFARTQAPHDWASPPYDFTPRQRQKWRRLWQAMQAEDAVVEAAAADHDEAEDPEELRQWVMTTRERACLEFCVELLNQRQRGHEYESALVCAMAVLGRSEHGWRSADSYPPILSKVIKIARFFVVQKALWLDPAARQIIDLWRRRQTDVPWALTSADDGLEDLDEGYVSASPSSGPVPSYGAMGWAPGTPSSYPNSRYARPLARERSREPPSSAPSSAGFGTPVYPVRSSPMSTLEGGSARTFPEQVERMVQRFMIRGTQGPMQTLLDWRTYGLKVHFNSTAPGHVAWLGADEILYKDIQFTMGGFRGFVHGLTGATRDLLQQLLFTETPPAIPWRKLYDDPTESTPGWSFLRDARTPWPVVGRRWLIDRVRADPLLQREFIRTDHFHPPKVRAYFQRVARFKEQLAVLVHMVAGQPGRIPELLSLQHVNTDRNRRRSIYIEDGMVTLVSAYHKGFYASNDTKVIHRYLPREVGELLVYYLWLVLPFVQQLIVASHPPRSTLPDGHSPGVSTGADLDNLAPVETTAVWPTGESDDPPVGHKARDWSYLWSVDPGSGRAWSSDRFRRILQRETEARLSRKGVTILAYRDIAVGISRRFLRPSSQFAHNQQEERATELTGIDADDEDRMDPEQWVGHIADLQAAHSSHLAGLMYGRQVTEAAGTTAHRQAMFRLSSEDWHRFLGFPSAQAAVDLPSALGKRKRAPWEEAAGEHRVWRQHRLSQADVTQAARQMTGQAGLQLRGVQGPALRAIQDGASPAVAVMPTGGGKSMLFMLPAWLEPGGTTIVVVPLLSLRQDLQRRCQRLGIACVAWESRCPPDDASIVLVTPESTEHPDFHSFVNRLRVQQRLDRVVVDECHIVLNDQADFRPAMRRLGHLTAARTQMVYLTATLPPSEEPRFFERIGHARETARMFRGRTSRANIRYGVWRPALPAGVSPGPQAWLETAAVQDFVQRQIRQARPGKVILYANVVSQVTAMARLLDCPAYYSGQPDRAGVLQQFIDGAAPVLVATSALGMGVDIPDIRCIIHLGAPRTLLDYAQESGRAGRDGQASTAIIIQPLGWDTPARWMGEMAPGESERVQGYLEARCRRQALDRYLDGPVDGDLRQDCHNPAGDTPCDQCQPVAIIERGSRPAESISPRSNTPSSSRSRSRSESFISQAPYSMHPDPSPHRGVSPARPFSPVGDTGGSRARHWPQADFQAQQQMRQERLTEEQVAETALQWQDHCYICTLQGRDGASHDLYGCRAADSQTAKRWMVQVRRQIQYARYSACFQCGMPQAVCPGWENRSQCAYRGILIPMVASMVFGPQAPVIQGLWQQRLQQAGVDYQDEGAIITFLGQTGRPRHSQLFDIYCWLREIYREIEDR
ncbi:uncharacterized protein KD926_004698 [Aspergillus affinis]|uniref:uncharacterized protein n=1 Tax=Aspergillus affinis TaxID=1070780 RepID=UPI0022FEE8BB|nr:uncharacterized protein KD926_004698 [Aspergillus affinis]KAI9035034.1 hypothetical protein KD926_004698 [Aspergillus affinis]